MKPKDCGIEITATTRLRFDNLDQPYKARIPMCEDVWPPKKKTLLNQLTHEMKTTPHPRSSSLGNDLTRKSQNTKPT
jgi:hypothetical protein